MTKEQISEATSLGMKEAYSWDEFLDMVSLSNNAFDDKINAVAG